MNGLVVRNSQDRAAAVIDTDNDPSFEMVTPTGPPHLLI
jgi:hypothetical protein